jgi:hypothetical protein
MPGRDSGALYDPRERVWAFDSSTLINLCLAGLLPQVRQRFKGRAHLLSEVLAELDKGDVGPEVRADGWYEEVSVELPEEFAKYAALRQQWLSAVGRDKGEAATITKVVGGRWMLVMEDGIGYSTAVNVEGVCTMRTYMLIAAMVKAGWINGDEGWAALQRLVNDEGRWLGPMPWPDRRSWDQYLARARFQTCLF